MKKISIAMVMIAGLISSAQLSAQTIPEGINHLYADRDQSAKAVFEKLLAANPNNLDAVYWLGQTFLEMNDVNGARQLYDKTLTTNGNAPLILVGRGHVDLIDGKNNEARQRFEAAITASKGKKGDDPNVLNAIGRASADSKAKTADIAYGIEKLKIAAERDAKNADILLNLGDAYRKAHDGSNAVTNYQKALTINPALARAQYRTAMIYYTQKNWEVYLEDLNKAIAIDPKFAPAYYELYYYNFYRKKFTEADNYAKQYIASSDPDVQNDFFLAQNSWINKDYKGAINTLNGIISKAGENTRPRVYKLLAYSHADAGDTASAKKALDTYFAKASDEEVVPQDRVFQAQIESSLGADNATVIRLLEVALAADTIYKNKIDLLQESIENAKTKGNKEMQASLYLMLYRTRKDPYNNDLFNAGYTYYQGGLYPQADTVFDTYNKNYPDSIYGYYWGGITNTAMDTAALEKEPYVTKIVNSFKKTLEIAGMPANKERFKSQAVRASIYLTQIYNNTKKDRDSAIYFIDKGLEIDPTNANLLGIKEQLKKPVKGAKPAGNNGSGSKPSSMIKPEADKSKNTAAKK